MATYGFDDLDVKIDSTEGGTLASVKAYVFEISGLEIEAVTEESHTIGDSWAEALYTGLRKANEVTMKGFYDDTATTGPDAMLNAVGQTRSFQFTWGGSKTSAFESIITKYKRIPARGELTKFECSIQPTGEVTEN